MKSNRCRKGGSAMIDAYELGTMNKTKPLAVGETGRATVCVLCGGPIGGGGQIDWTVSIPAHGKAHLHCAVDNGFTLRR